jgi:hypothetical protein
MSDKPDSGSPASEPVGYLAAYELSRLNSGHDALLRSARYGPSYLDGDVPVYLGIASPPALPVPYTAQVIAGQDRDLFTAEQMVAYGQQCAAPAHPPAALPEGWLAEAERLIRLRKNVGNAEYERQCEDWLKREVP